MSQSPLIAAAALLESPKLAAAGSHILVVGVTGGVVAGVAAFLSVRFLMRYFTTNRLNPFARYCIGVGLVVKSAGFWKLNSAC